MVYVDNEIGPLDVTITGIDGSGKSTTISHLVDKLASEYVVAHSGRPSYIVGPDMDKREYLFESSLGLIDRMHGMGDKLESRTAIALANIVNVIMWCERHNKIVKDYNPDIIFSGRHRIIDSAVYSVYYFPLANKLSHNMRTSIAEKIISADESDLLIYLDITPEISVQRIENRIEVENKKTGLVRPKWKHMHENPEDLAYLRHEYELVLGHYDELGWDIRKINVEEMSQEDVVDIIEELIKEKLVSK